MRTGQTERRLLELLRPRYEEQGYTFILKPLASDLPPFMAGFRPDALALGDDVSIAIEVIVHRPGRSDQAPPDIVERFNGRTDWKLHVINSGVFEKEAIAPATREQIRSQIDEAHGLLARGHGRAALMLASAALVAAARLLRPKIPTNDIISVRQALNVLEHLGHLLHDETEPLRTLAGLNEKVVHGDMSDPVTRAEVEPMLMAAMVALEAEVLAAE